MKMRWLFLIAALFASACIKKKTTKEELQPVERDTGILSEEDLEGLPES